jgi:hypothetical protein
MVKLLREYLDALAGTVYEPWVNAILFVGFVALMWSTVAWLLTRRPSSDLLARTSRGLKYIRATLEKNGHYAPAVQRRIERVEPYLVLTSSIFYAFTALLYGVSAAVLTALLRESMEWQQVTVATIFAMACMVIARSQLVTASWAYHRIKSIRPRRQDKR